MGPRLPAVSAHGDRAEGLSGAFHRALVPLMEAPPHDPMASKGPPLHSIAVGVRVLPENSGETQTFRP